jgi:TANFOR domain-containing protein
MIWNKTKKITWLLVLSGLLSAQAVKAQYPLGIQVNIAPPYPIRLSDFTGSASNIFITVTNSTQQTYKIFLTGSLRNEDNGMTISTDPNAAPGECIEIMPGGRTLTGAELSELFDPSRLVYRGTTMDIIRGDQALPEGRYTLCLRAESCEQRGRFYSPIPTDMDGCSFFEIAYVEPPEITAPDCGTEVDATSGIITFLWSFIPPASGMGSIRFKLEMIELEPATRNPTEAFSNSPFIFEKDEIQITSYNLHLNEDVTLESGHTYAYRIVAYDPEDKIQFKNAGKSQICTFLFGSGGGTPTHPLITAEYPKDGDVIPFTFFPLIVKFDPYDNNYHRFVSDVSIVTRSSAFDSWHRDLNWPSGPLTTQRNATGFGDLTQEQSQNIAVYKNLSDVPSPPPYKKEDEYTWNTSVEIERNGRTLTVPQISSSFKVGMGASKLKEPANNDTVPPGQINFQWKTADEPQKILPDFAIVQASRASGVTFFNGIVNERWVIEVSRSSSFDTIVNSMAGRLGANIDLMSTEQAVKNELYKDLEEHFTITRPGRYYWRVKWMISPDNVSDNRHYVTSDVFSFVIGTGTSVPPSSVVEADTSGGCISVCAAPPITDRTARSGLAVGETLKIGKFTLQVQTLTSSSGTQFTGDGYVQIPFLNNVKIKVDFRNIQYNTAREIFSGTVTAKEDRGFLSEEVNTRIGQVISMAGPEAEALNDFLNDGERIVSAFTGAREIGMPIGIDREIDGNRYTIGIIDMEFTPENATMNAVMNLNFPQIGNYLIAFGVKDLCFTPSGLGDEGRLYLARDWQLFQDGETTFVFKGAESADTSASCYISWDCHGFLCARIQGEVTFPRTMLVPDQEDGTPGSGNVKGSFSFKGCRGNNFMASITMDPFQIKGVDGWGWVASNAWLDFSDLENPPGFRLPDTYADTALLSGGSRMINTWQGFYMENIEVRAPGQFQNSSTSTRISFGVRNTIIDGTGLTTSIRVNNVLPISQGTFQGWGISLDTINIDFVSNTFREGGISGKLGIPIFADGQNLNYRMALTYRDDKLNYICRVFARDTLTVPMWAARLRLRPDSEIRIQIGDSTFASTNLSGDIGINGDLISGGSSIPGLNFQGMVFEGLKLSTSEPHFDIDSVYFSHASPQKSVAGFPINIRNINLNLNEISRPGIDFDLDLVLGDFSATAGFGVFGRLSFEGGRFSAGFDGIDLRSISIDQTISSIRLRGGLEFFNRDATYGNGVKGYLDVTLPMELRASITVQFGTKRTSPTAEYNTAGYFSYWFVDGLVTFPGGVPIFSGFGIYGFGGGAYHHMRIDASTLPSASSTIAGTGSGGESVRTSVRYIPDFNTFLGMKLTAVLGTHPSSEAFNMDASISAEFNSSGGLNYIGISANGYIMASISDRSSAKVWANVNITFSIPADGNPVFHGDFNVYVNVNDILTGAGSGYRFVNATFHVDREKWYFYMGTLTDRAGLKLRLGPIQADLLSYLMVGYDIPTVLPPPPDEIRDLLYGSGGGKLGTEGAVAAQLASQTRDASQSKYNSGRGFAFGVFFDLRSELDFAIFYASLRLMLGFDLNVTEDDKRVCAETGTAPGMNNWYATGQVYAGLWGEMGVKVDLWFISGRFPFISLAAAVMLKGGLPNPDWFSGRAGLHYSVLNGLVEGQCNFEVSVGQRCSVVDANPFSDVEFIGDVRPQDEDSPASVFEQPRVSFNLPVEKILEFPAGTDDNPTLTRRFKPFLASFKLIKNDGSGAVVPGRFEMSENNTIATYKFEEALESTTSYKIEVVVQSDEHFRDGSVRRVMISGRPWEERREVTFTTQERPDIIVPENVRYTYPVENQKFFLQGETNRRTGLLKFHRAGQSYLFYSTKDGVSYTYHVRFKPIPEGDPIEVSLQTRGLYVDFNVPSLENNKMYAVQFIRKRTSSRQEQMMGRIGTTTALPQSQMRTTAVALTPLRVTLELSSVNIKRDAKLLPGLTINPGEFLLYNFYFKTSKYNTLQEKLATSMLTAEYKNILIAELFDIKTVISEYFDEFDIRGVYKNGEQVLKPLLGTSAPFTYSYHTTRAKPYVYDLMQNLQDFMYRTPSLFGTPSIAQLNRHGKGKPPVQSVSFGNGFIESPLTEQDVERTAGINRYATYLLATTIANPGITNMLNGRTTSLTSQGSYQVVSASALPPDPSNFRLIYETSNYVFQDFNLVKSNVGRVLSANFFGTYLYRESMQSNNPQLLNECNQLLRKSIADFKLSNGEYGINMIYRYPTSNGNENSGGTPVLKTFYYGTAPLRLPTEVRGRTL